jgi:hypothetical protein
VRVPWDFLRRAARGKSSIPAAPAREPLGWRAQRDAALGATCIQAVAALLPTPMSEDCLFANVYTPQAAPLQPPPVLVFIHGGAFTTGAGSLKESHPALPFIVITAAGAIAQAVDAVKRGAFRYLVKPCDAEDLRKVVTEALDPGRRQPTEASSLAHRPPAASFVRRPGATGSPRALSHSPRRGRARAHRSKERRILFGTTDLRGPRWVSDQPPSVGGVHWLMQWS